MDDASQFHNLLLSVIIGMLIYTLMLLSTTWYIIWDQQLWPQQHLDTLLSPKRQPRAGIAAASRWSGTAGGRQTTKIENS
jgi:hypothetical protein